MDGPAVYKECTTVKMYELIPYLVSVGNGWTVSDTVWTMMSMRDIEAVVMDCLKLQTGAK